MLSHQKNLQEIINLSNLLQCVRIISDVDELSGSRWIYFLVFTAKQQKKLQMT